MAIKVSLGKYVLHESFEDFTQHALVDNGFLILPIDPKHAARVAILPFSSGDSDPFDRLLVAQAMVEQLSIVSGDTALDAYGITRFW